MKNKTLSLLLAGTAGLSLSATATAQTVIELTGSTAFRSATHNAILDVLSGEIYGYTGTSFTGASQAIFKGTIGGNPVIVKTSWSGSVGGIQTVSNSLNVNFLANPDGSDQVGGITLTSGGAGSIPTGTTPGIPDIAMADNLQSVTPFTANALTEKKVGVVPFVWVCSASGTSTAIDNMTPQLAQALYFSGSLPLSMWTGVPGDAATTVFALGRDPDSGTRVVTFAESGIGVSTLVTQWQPTISGTAITGHIPWPESTVNGITFPEGDGGYSSGGSSGVAGAMRKTTAALGGFYVSYVGVSDSTSVIAAADANGFPGKVLKYNGVDQSTANIQEGKYTFWGYEYLSYLSTLTGVPKTFADALENQIKTVRSPILLSTMKVSRPLDGGLVTP